MKPAPLRMPEAEVSLRFAVHLLHSGAVTGEVSVAIDGAQVQTRDTAHFDPKEFLDGLGWIADTGTRNWQGTYRATGLLSTISIHSRPGLGDVTATLTDGSKLIAEAKKGPLERSKSSQEYPLLREALGQLLTISEIPANPVLLVLVPHSPKFAELAARWRRAPLIQRAGIGICTVGQDGTVHGWQHAA